MENCFYCRGEMKPAARTHVVDLGKSIVIIKNVPCMACSQCGEGYYTDEVQQRLDEIVKTAGGIQTEVVIAEYSASAAESTAGFSRCDPSVDDSRQSTAPAYKPDYYYALLADGAFLARRFRETCGRSFLCELLAQRETALLREYLPSARPFDESFSLALFYLCKRRDYVSLRVMLEAGVDCNAVFQCPGDHGENALTPFLFFCATTEPEDPAAYAETLAAFLRCGASKIADYSGFYVDGPGISGTYQQFTYSLEALAREKENLDGGALYRALFG